MSDIDKAVEAVFDENNKNKNTVVLAGNKIKLTGFGNLRDYLNELHDYLVDNDFVDILFPGLDTPRPSKEGGGTVMLKKGEFPDPETFNRNSDMFEKEFRDVDLGGGFKEYEILWDAVAPVDMSYFSDARFIFNFKVVIRRCETKEFEENGKKIQKQGGTWEFECKYKYQCKDLPKRLNNIPILGHWNWTRKLYFNKFLAPYVEKDIYTSLKILGEIRGIAVKYFSLLK